VTLASETPAPRPTGPPRVLGVAALAFAMFNCVVGASIFRLPAEVAAMLGAAAVLAYVGCTLILVLMGLCLAEAGSRVSEAGGLYAYAAVAFGPVVGGMMGVMILVSYLTGAAAVANLVLENLGALWPVANSATARAVLIVAIFAVLAAVNIRGAREGARLSAFFALGKLVPLFAIALLGLLALEPVNLRWEHTPEPRRLGEAVVLLFFAFGGLEMGLTAGGEARDPRRTIPRAIFVAVLLITLLYLSLQLAAQGVLGAALPGAVAPLASVASKLLGPWGMRCVLAATLLSASGYLVADVLCSPRAIYALAVRGQLPRPLAALHPRTGTPSVAVGLYALVATLLTLSGSFRALALLSSCTTFLMYLVTCFSLLRLRARGVAQAGAPFRAPGGTLLPLVTAALVLGLLLAVPARQLLLSLVPAALAGLAFALQEKLKRVRGAATGSDYYPTPE
jgi:basic amino acid/polyamine antiporter, APA family